MTSLFPGALWRPMPGQERRPKRRKGRGVGFHIAVSERSSIYDINLGTGNDAHLYVRRDGGVEQNIDLDLVAYAGAAGNPSMIWVETQGGTTPADVKSGLWVPAQAATLARIARWAHDTEGVPLQLMPDSKPASRGIGTHRLGIQHSRGIGAVPGWLIPGGEKWSSAVGKECPGDARVAQLPSIIAAAAGGATQEDDMPLTAADFNEIESRAYRGVGNLIAAMNRGDHGSRDAFLGLVRDGAGPTIAELRGEVAGLRTTIEQIAAAPASAVDLGAVFQAAQDGARSIVDNLRVVADADADGDKPAAGPVS